MEILVAEMIMIFD